MQLHLSATLDRLATKGEKTQSPKGAVCHLDYQAHSKSYPTNTFDRKSD